MRRRQILTAGGLLILSFVVWVVSGALFFGKIEELDDGGRARYLGIAGQVADWRWSNLLFAVGTLIGLVGVVRLARAVRTPENSQLVTVAVALAWVGSIVWCLEVAARLTISVTEAREVAAGGPEPASLIGGWPANGWGATSAIAFVALPLLALAARTAGVLGRRTAIVLAVLGAAAAIAALVSYIPFFGVEFAALLGVVLVIRGLRMRVPTSPASEAA